MPSLPILGILEGSSLQLLGPGEGHVLPEAQLEGLSIRGCHEASEADVVAGGPLGAVLAVNRGLLRPNNHSRVEEWVSWALQMPGAITTGDKCAWFLAGEGTAKPLQEQKMDLQAELSISANPSSVSRSLAAHTRMAMAFGIIDSLISTTGRLIST